jgi:hypothetical protein
MEGILTNPDSLPVWAKILLGIPGDEEICAGLAEQREPSNQILRQAGPSEYDGSKQSVIVFGGIAVDRKWRWQSHFRPLPGELNS